MDIRGYSWMLEVMIFEDTIGETRNSVRCFVCTLSYFLARRGTYSTAGSAASTPVHSIRRGYEGRGFGSSASPRAVPQLTDLPPASPGGGTPWQGARGEPGSDIVSGSRGAEQGR